MALNSEQQFEKMCLADLCVLEEVCVFVITPTPLG